MWPNKKECIKSVQRDMLPVFLFTEYTSIRIRILLIQSIWILWAYEYHVKSVLKYDLKIREYEIWPNKK